MRIALATLATTDLWSGCAIGFTAGGGQQSAVIADIDTEGMINACHFDG